MPHAPRDGADCSARNEGGAREAEMRLCRDTYDGREFGCSACGERVHLLVRDEAGEWRRATPGWCPACGAKVAEDER